MQRRMSANSTAYLIPLAVAFFLFLGKVYGPERAMAGSSPSFYLAALSVLLAVGYLAGSVLALLPPYSGLAVGLIGLGMLGIAVLLIRRF
jgi:hypothetical protein